MKNVYERKGEIKFGICIGTICTGGKIHFCLVLIHRWRQVERKETEKLPSLKKKKKIPKSLLEFLNYEEERFPTAHPLPVGSP